MIVKSSSWIAKMPFKFLLILPVRMGLDTTSYVKISIK